MKVIIKDNDYKPTPEDVAEEIWNSEVWWQVEMLDRLAIIDEPFKMHNQLSAINDELSTDPKLYRNIINFVKELAEYLTGD